MAAKHPHFGVNHVTVVPANFEPERSREQDGELGDDDVDGTDEDE